MTALTLRSYAKINWFLRVREKRPDGFHELETIFQSISLHDTLRFKKSSALEFSCDDGSIPTGESNLVVRAARLMIERFGAHPATIHLSKNIPAGGGLGGGSSNAAATLRGMAALSGLSVPVASFHEAATELGSDVPFFLVGGTAHATGRGEVLTALDDVPAFPLLLVFPKERLLTPDVFRNLNVQRSTDRLPPPERQHHGAEWARELMSGLPEHASDLTNDLEAVAANTIRDFTAHVSQLRELGAWWAGMTGSGSTIVGAFKDDDRSIAESPLELRREFSGLTATPALTISRSEALQF